MATKTATRRHTVRHLSHSPWPPSGRTSRAALDLSALPTAPGRARAWTRQILSKWCLVELSDMAEVVVSELATNAMLASRQVSDPWMRLVLTLDEGELTIFVRDYCPGFPQPRDVGDDEENGRGLLLVEAMSSRSGWYPAVDGNSGKVVWAALSR